MENAGGPVKAGGAMLAGMARTDDTRLAAALRENLRKRKAQARAADTRPEPEPSFGSDEEGDVAIPDNGDRPGAWSSEGSKRI